MTTPVPAATARAPRATRSKLLAGALAVGGLALAVALIDYGAERGGRGYYNMLGWGVFMVGPSAGHIYAENFRHAAITSGIRAAGFTLSVWAGLQHDRDYDLAVIVGSQGLVLTALYSIIDAPFAARRFNRRAAATPMLGPTVIRATDGAVAGLSVSGTF